MNDQPSRSGEREDEAFGRPLPDGGLGETMPDWLRRPPAWHGALPPDPSHTPLAPDTSPIDPGTLIDIDDLPPWLQRIAARGEALTPQPLVPSQPPPTRGRSIPTESEGELD
nr:hypothetical protein [Chloroflexia bacterium]